MLMIAAQLNKLYCFVLFCCMYFIALLIDNHDNSSHAHGRITLSPTHLPLKTHIDTWDVSLLFLIGGIKGAMT